MKKITLFLVFMIALAFSTDTLSGKFNLGIISAVKNKVKQLKEKKDEYYKAKQQTSIGTLDAFEEAANDKDTTVLATLFTEQEWNRSGTVFVDNKDSLPNLADVLKTKTLVKETEDIAIYCVTDNSNSDAISYYIFLVKESGVWKIGGL